VSARAHHDYTVCGLRLRSALSFPELTAAPGPGGESAPDIELEVSDARLFEDSGNTLMTKTQEDGTPWLTCTRTREGYRFRFPAFADFLADREGLRITLAARPDTAPETLRHLFLDQVVPLLLNLRGRDALHASAIQTASGACAFLGRSGRGKSTLAAAFHLLGYPVLCDDCLLLKGDAGHVAVEPAYPGLRLWDDSLEFLFGSAPATQPVSHYTSKRRISTLPAGAAGAGLQPLRAVYSLQQCADGAAPEVPAIEPLTAREAFVELFEYSFRLDAADRAMIERQMGLLERVAREVPVKRLRIPGHYQALAAARDLVLRDLAPG